MLLLFKNINGIVYFSVGNIKYRPIFFNVLFASLEPIFVFSVTNFMFSSSSFAMVTFGHGNWCF